MVIKLSRIQKVRVEFYNTYASKMPILHFIKIQAEITKEYDFRYITVDNSLWHIRNIFYFV
jgi:hypothetical protein